MLRQYNFTGFGSRFNNYEQGVQMINKKYLAVPMLLLMLLSMAVTAPLSAATGVAWSYSGDTDPGNWGNLSVDYELCGTGLRQSPVDLSVTEKENLPGIKYDYQNVDLSIENNGHTIEAHYHAHGEIIVNGNDYDLLQFHFHTPSEHTENSTAAAMEMHLVHINSDSQLAVIGVLINEGEANPFFEDIIGNAPVNIGTVDVANVKINAKNLLPEHPSRYMTYRGSLTTPPCSESVRWMVLNNRIEVSRDQIDRFLKIIGENARPVQFLNNREIRKRK